MSCSDAMQPIVAAGCYNSLHVEDRSMHAELNEEYLSPAWSWYTKWCNPIIASMYLGDRDAVRRMRQEAWDALAACDLDDDRRQCAYYRLSYVSWQELLRLGTHAEAMAGYTRLLDQLSSPPQGPLSAAMCQRMQLQSQCHADVEGLADCSVSEYLRLRSGLPQYLRDPELYHFVASWAFKHRQQETLEESLEIMTFNSTGYQSDFSWQRVNLMHLLLQGRATQRDVLELIKRLGYPHHWRVVQTSLWNAVEAAGLADSKVQAALAAKLDQLHAMPPKAPGHADSTKRIRKDL